MKRHDKERRCTEIIFTPGRHTNSVQSVLVLIIQYDQIAEREIVRKDEILNSCSDTGLSENCFFVRSHGDSAQANALSRYVAARMGE